jgi:hypothetical protein
VNCQKEIILEPRDGLIPVSGRIRPCSKGSKRLSTG